MPFHLRPGKHNPIKQDHWPSKEETLKLLDSGYSNPADETIGVNNVKADIASIPQEQHAGLASGDFLTKQLVKEGLKKYVGPVASKAFGLGTMMLTTQSAYARGPGEFIDGEYVRNDDYTHPKFDQTFEGKHLKSLDLPKRPSEPTDVQGYYESQPKNLPLTDEHYYNLEKEK